MPGRIAAADQQALRIGRPVGGLTRIRPQPFDQAHRAWLADIAPPQPVRTGAVGGKDQLTPVRRDHRLIVAPTRRKQAPSNVATIHRVANDLIHTELRFALRKYQMAMRHIRCLRIVHAQVVQAAVEQIEPIQPRLNVHATPEDHTAAVGQPAPAPDIASVVGEPFGRAAFGRNPPQIAKLRITQEYDPMPIRRITRCVIEITGMRRIVQRLPLPGLQIQATYACCAVAAGHAAEQQRARPATS